MKFACFYIVTAVLVSAILFPSLSHACTGFYRIAKDGGVVYARSLEFAADLDSQVAVAPRGTAYAAEMPDGSKGLEWKSKYGIMGMAVYGSTLFLDGFNEKGLQVGMFYFPGFAQYAPYEKGQAKTSLSPVVFGSWLLSNFATLDEVRENVNKIRIVPTKMEQLGIVPPLHTFVVDQHGNSIVIEPIDGKLVVSDNPVHTFTNSPSFDWHLTNLRQYIHLSTREDKPIELGGLKLERIGSGSGMIGIPGDITPPSRFVRAAYFSNMIPALDTVEQELGVAMRFMSYFFITKGMVIEPESPTKEYTQWLIFTDLKHKRLYFSDYDNMNIRMVDMAKFNLDSGPVKRIGIDQPQEFPDISGQAK